MKWNYFIFIFQWQYDNIENFNSFHQCITRLRFHFPLHSNELFPNKTFTSNEQNISKRKAGEKKKPDMLKKNTTIFDFKGISFSWGREMKIACSFYDTWKKEAEKGVPFLFSSQEHSLHCPQFLVFFEIARSFA